MKYNDKGTKGVMGFLRVCFKAEVGGHSRRFLSWLWWSRAVAIRFRRLCGVVVIAEKMLGLGTGRQE